MNMYLAGRSRPSASWIASAICGGRACRAQRVECERALRHVLYGDDPAAAGSPVAANALAKRAPVLREHQPRA